MAQNAPKSKPRSTGSSSSTKSRNAGKQTPRNRVFKPKKASLITAQKIKKKNAAGLVTQTEKLLAERAGHMEVLKGGKKDRGKAKAKEGRAKA
ncbi:uncharacterized protein BDR25DRAFT_304631 [Lindgomyces ingoldianus]|uniref:Uncharacterized protein n=1 Tax=Lindgomyces ingoldianus TaxID=673940 RepID=A0ACB6QSP5_9PLEO|nr:uncharacterized protein BDR25DRAFT_304631 [Lindgomyces ingoldianus]KAF2469102.1 hypothetical protein BDR25DRAFT_304631 [Lindgomyces ingoldianus]